MNEGFLEIARAHADRVRVVQSAARKSRTSALVFRELADLFPWMADVVDDPSFFAPLDVRRPRPQGARGGSGHRGGSNGNNRGSGGTRNGADGRREGERRQPRQPRSESRPQRRRPCQAGEALAGLGRRRPARQGPGEVGRGRRLREHTRPAAGARVPSRERGERARDARVPVHGPAGSNKTMAAYALAQALLCPKGPHGPRGGKCGACDICRRVMRKKHPDVRYFAPEGAGGYLVDQIRDIAADTALAPIQADRKIYILDRVDLLGVQAANAFLKTLEEPPSDVVLILWAARARACCPPSCRAARWCRSATSRPARPPASWRRTRARRGRRPASPSRRATAPSRAASSS
ncbi:MAG: hypothetical protein V8S24_01595 [Gordonibacter pamelaeae]